MVGLDWIPIISSTINNTAPGRRYVTNRIPKLRKALLKWADEQEEYRLALEGQSDSLAWRRQLETFAMLVSMELKLLSTAVGKLEIWAKGGRKTSLLQAQRAYEKSQQLWKRRMALVRNSVM